MFTRQSRFFLIIGGTVLFISSGISLDLKKLQEELKKRGNPWIAGETKISKYYESLSPEEQEQFLNSVDLSSLEKYATPMPESKEVKKPPPSEWDWRNKDGKNWMSGVREQGDCNSCWAHTFLAAWEARINIWEGVPERDIDLSEQFVISCRREGGYPCNLGSFYHVIGVINHYGGVPDEDCFPYTASNQSCNNKCEDWEDRLYKITDYGIHQTASASMFKNKIMDGPVGAYVTMREDFLYYKGGVYEPIMGKTFNHGVAFIGWTAQGAWIVKNSWGTDWGDSGYGEYTGNYGYLLWMVPLITASKIDYETHIIEDSMGNNNGEINPGENIKLPVTAKRTGSAVAGVGCTLKVNDSYVTVTQSYSNFGNMGSGESKKGTPPFELSISPDAPVDYSFTCNLIFVDNNLDKWEDTFDLTIVGVAQMIVDPRILSFFYYEQKKHKGEIDTIYYDDGVKDNYWDLSSYQYAVRFTPEEECSLIAGLMYLKRTLSSVKTCTVMVYEDDNGLPGNEIYRTTFDIGRTDWQWIEVPLSVYVEGDFWIGIGDFSFIVNLGRDEEADAGRTYRKRGSNWTQRTDGDGMIRAIVSTGQVTDTGRIWVKNYGTGTLNISNIQVKNNSSWMGFVDPSNMSIGVNDSQAITVGIDTTGLSVDVAYWDTIVISSNDPIYSTYNVPVKVLISTQPNTAPIISDIPDQQFKSGDSVIIVLDSYVVDDQDPCSELLWDYEIIGGADSLLISINPDRVATIKAIVPWSGEKEVIFKVTDTGGLVDEDTITVIVDPVGVEDFEKTKAYGFSLTPNPSLNKVNILYQIPVSTFVKIEVYDIGGRLVEKVVNELKKAGLHTTVWTPKNNGIYFCKIKANKYNKTLKCIIIK